MNHGQHQNASKAAFVCLFVLSALPAVSSPVALVAGLSYSVLVGNPLPGFTSRTSKSLLKLSVVGLGFGVNFIEVVEIGKSSLLFTLLSIGVTLALGGMLGRALGVTANTRTLVSFGTAICGGSAIAVLAPVIKAEDEELAVSLATVFALNAAALILFPPLGHLLELDQHQFGLWAALAIHDTSSVVGASAAFGAVALTIGTTVKLTRALWIAPCALVASVFCKSEQRAGLPLFIIGFVAASFVSSWLPTFELVWNGFYTLSRHTLVMTLFLVGAGLTRPVLRRVGLRPLLLGIILWAVVSVTTLALILKGYI